MDDIAGTVGAPAAAPAEGRAASRTRATAVLALAALAVLLVALVLLPVVVVPLLLALFPAALLAPAARRLRGAGIPGALVAALCVAAALTAVVLLLALVLPLVAAELPLLVESLAAAIADVRATLEGSALGLRLDGLDPLLARLEGLVEPAPAAPGAPLDGEAAVGAATVAAGAGTGVLLGMVALFFYLADGPRIARGLRDSMPARLRPHAEELGTRMWVTLGGYIRGQLLVAVVDALFIGLGLLLLGVPLAFPLALLVLLGGLFPIVGAVGSGAVAVLVALADAGLGLALAVLALVVAVQQLESNLLQPLVLGRATRLHPLLVIVAITAGGLLLGVLGAFVAVPLAACLARALDYVRELGARPAAA